MSNNQPQASRYIPYSSWDDIQFWIGQEIYGRDFPTWEEADDYGAFQVRDIKGAYAAYKEVGPMTYEQVQPFM